MARIRSIHPDQWCDEDFVELSMGGRLLAIALRNFSDDKGVFEWKPKTIKMKVFPADDVNVDAELDALLMQNQCIKFTSNGKSYGAIRNFLKYQRPKKPNNIYPITPTAALYVGYEGETSPEPASDELHQMGERFPIGGEIAPQMEDGGCSLEIDKSISCPFSDFWKVWPNKVSKTAAEKAWKKLSAADKQTALSQALSWFEGWRKRNPEASAIHAATFLNNKRWLDEAEGSAPEHTDGEILYFFAKTVIDKHPTAPRTVKPEMAGRLMDAGLVTADQLKQAGVAI